MNRFLGNLHIILCKMKIPTLLMQVIDLGLILSKTMKLSTHVLFNHNIRKSGGQ